MLNEASDLAVLEFMRAHPDEVESLKDKTIANTLGLDRRVNYLFRPKDQKALLKILSFCNANAIAVHPVSAGKNWGFGSMLPAVDGVAILHLGALSKIIDYDPELGTITIEPGVTQKQAADFLKDQGSNFFLNVTGAGQHTSIVGNAVERGVAYRSQRTTDVLAFEAITPSGKTIRSGFSNSKDKISELYCHGIGPEIAGLFFQSTFGIVTRMTIALRKKQEVSVSLIANFKEADMGAFTNAVIDLLSDEVLDFIPHIASKKRFFEITEPLLTHYKNIGDQSINIPRVLTILKKMLPHDFVMSGSLSGPRDIVRVKIRNIKKKLKSLAILQMPTDLKEKASQVLDFFGIKEVLFLLRSFEGLRGFGRGVPSDDAIFAFDPSGKDPDHSDIGFMYVSPLGPFTSQTAKKFVEIKNAVDAKYAVDSAMTLNPITRHVLESVWSISFIKNDALDKERTVKAADEFMRECRKAGYLPYRLPTGAPQDHDLHSQDHKELLASLKDYFDPNRIISPGRYS